ncbi:Probable oligoribonuclease [Anthophora plagiata]
MAYDKSDCIVWLDTELTGLDIEKDTILEVACIITDKNLNVVSEEFSVVINHSDEILENMAEWSRDNHLKTGLTQKCKSSKIRLKEAEEMLLNYLKKYIPENTCPLAGNTIYVDRVFLHKHMPLVNNYLHYRIIDVSTIKELTRRWYPTIYENSPTKQFRHRALQDIKESIQELKYYANNICIPRVL